MSATVFSDERLLKAAETASEEETRRKQREYRDYVCKVFFPAVVDVIGTIWNREDWGRPIKGVNLRDPATQFYQHKEGSDFNFGRYEVTLYLEEHGSDWFNLNVHLFTDDPEGVLHVRLKVDNPYFICWDPTAILQEITNTIGRKFIVKAVLGPEKRTYTLSPEILAVPQAVLNSLS